MTVRVLVVDDHPLFLDGVRAALAAAEDLEVVGAAGDGRSALAAAADLLPDVVLLDVGLPDGSGIDVARALLADRPGVRVLMMTMSDEDSTVVAAMRAGARGYVVKGAGRADLLAGIRTVAAGGAVFGPGVADRLGGFFASLAALPGQDAFPTLTEREREVLDLMARGYDNRRMARELFLSDKTVRNHVSNILGKLDVESRGEAAIRARNAGLGG
jgi:DNA-binding NarL/FixJ family response regulator